VPSSARKSSDAIAVDSPRPLHNFPLIRSRDVEEVRSCIARFYGKPVLVPARRAQGFDAIINACQFRNIGICYSTFGADIGFEFPPAGLFSQLFPIRGTGEATCGQTSFGLIAGAGVVIPPDTSHNSNISADYEHLVLRINPRALTEKLVAMTGATITEPLLMDARQRSKHPAAQMLEQYLPLLVDTLSGAISPFPDWWIAQIEQLLMTLFLCGHRHNYSHLLEQDPRDTAPRQIRQAEEYIEANAKRAISLEELADITGVSAFSLFSSFKKHRGYSPLEFLSQVRSRGGGAQR
jgi:AraC-like protein